jgi:hypothetical protein
MTTALTLCRAEIAAILDNPTQWNTYDHVPASPTVNSVVLEPADPYVTSNNNSHLTIQPMFHFTITCIVPLLDNAAALNDIESLAFSVWALLAGSDRVFNIGAISAPSVLDPGGMLSVTIPIDTVGSWT